MPLPIHSEEVDLGCFHRPASRPSGTTFPALVLIHDVWGRSDHSRELATDLAREGFGVLEIGLYRDHGEFVIEDVGGHIRSLSDPAVLADLDAAADWLTERADGCRGSRVGVIGVCMGGLYAILAACGSDRFSAAAPFYGILNYETGLVAGTDGRDFEKKPHSPIETAARLRTPMLASFGCEDGFVPQEDVDAFEAGLATSGTAFEVDRYVGAGHAFLNRTRTEAYREEASMQAWARVVPFLHRELA